MSVYMHGRPGPREERIAKPAERDPLRGAPARPVFVFYARIIPVRSRGGVWTLCRSPFAL